MEGYANTDNTEQQQEQEQQKTDLAGSLKLLNSRQASTADNQVSSEEKLSNGFSKLRADKGLK